MGLLGAKKKTLVSSTVYNLAGDEDKRANFLKTTVIGAVIGGNDIADTLQDAYIGGPGVKLRNYPRWADSASSGYNAYMKQISSSLSFGDSIDDAALANILPHNPGETVNIQTAEIGLIDYSWWAEQWILTHDPSRLNENWNADYNSTEVVITWPDGSLTTFVPDNFNTAGRYLYVGFTTSTGLTSGPVVTGDTVVLTGTNPYPSTVGWTQDSSSSVSTPVTLNTKVDVLVTYSDGRPDESSTSTTGNSSNYFENHAVYSKHTYQGTTVTDSSTITKSQLSHMYQDQTGSVVAGTPSVNTTTEVIDGVTKTTKTTTTVDQIQLHRSYRIDTQDQVTSETSLLKIFIYLQGSGNPTLDAMFVVPEGFGEFMPFIPFRLDNKEVDATNFPEAYPLAKKAFKKSIGGKFDDVSASILNNDSIKDIDYTYAVFGVSLNVIEPACRKYIFKFLELLLSSGSSGVADYAAYQTQYQAAHSSQMAYSAWMAAQNTPSDPLYGTTAPAVTGYPPMPTQSVTISAPDNPIMNINFMISWNAIATASGAGIRAGHAVGDLWWEQGVTQQYDIVIANGVGGTEYTLLADNLTLFWQVDDNNWKSISVTGLTHTNTIYNGKSVEITAADAINDPDESGFIIPIQSELYNSISIVDATQMSTACAFLVFNCYKIVKQKWYQTILFKIIIIIIAIVIAVVSWGSGTPISSALVAAEVAAGTAIGLSVLASLIIAVVINTIAAMILSQLIGKIATSLFGPKIGPIIGAVVSVIAMNVAGAEAAGGSMADGFSSLTSASNLLALTEAVGQGVQGYINTEIQETINKTQKVLSDYNTQQKAIQDKYLDTFGSDSSATIDPLMFTDSSTYGNLGSYSYEALGSFLGRTLMNGTDIAQMSLQLIDNFCALTLSTDLSDDNFTV